MKTTAIRVTSVASAAPVISIREFTAHCRTCGVRELCLPVAFTDGEVKQFDALLTHRTKLKKQDILYRGGERFKALYAVQFGSLKTVVLAEDGREQVIGYHMLGDIIGFDGIDNNQHQAGAIALEDTEICALPFDSMTNLARSIPALQQNLHRMLSTELSRAQSAMLMLGSMPAAERVAIFLLNLADRYHRRGYSSTEYVLRMTREEIGSYLGLKLETVSRQFTRFHQEGLIHVQGRSVKLLNTIALKQITN